MQGRTVAVAQVRELTNLLLALDGKGAGEPWVLRFGWETAIRLLAPMMPHVAEELWAHLGHGVMLAASPWPDADPALAEDETVTVAVQINGKLRATLEVAKDLDRDALVALALENPNVQRQLDGKPPRKVIAVPNKIVNLVA